MTLIPLEEYRKEPEEHSPSPEGPPVRGYSVPRAREQAKFGSRPEAFLFFLIINERIFRARVLSMYIVNRRK